MPNQVIPKAELAELVEHAVHAEHQRTMPDMIDAIAAKVAEKVLAQLEMAGLVVAESDDRKELRKDFDFIRFWRTSFTTASQKVGSTLIWGFLISAGAAFMWMMGIKPGAFK